MRALMKSNAPNLEDIKPEGPWKTPLTEQRIQSALAFGADCAKVEFGVDEAFRVPTPDVLQAIVVFSSAFERIAKYAWLQTTRNERIDEQTVRTIANDPLLASHYAIDIVSPHKVISVLRYVPIIDARGVSKRDGYEGMLPLYRTRLDKALYRQVIGFPYVHTFPYDSLNTERVDYFEVVVPWLSWFPMIGKIMTFFEVHSYLYH